VVGCQEAGLVQVRGDLYIAVDVGLRAARQRTEEAGGRDFGGGVEQGAVARERSNGRKSSGRLCRVARPRAQRPLHTEIDRHGA